MAKRATKVATKPGTWLRRKSPWKKPPYTPAQARKFLRVGELVKLGVRRLPRVLGRAPTWREQFACGRFLMARLNSQSGTVLETVDERLLQEMVSDGMRGYKAWLRAREMETVDRRIRAAK